MKGGSELPETIGAKELPLVGVFNDNYRFEIPDYQRPYSWTTEQAGELLEDLMYASRQSADVSDASPYFLGSIVIIKGNQSPRADVVDGQQRLTTLTVLLSVLRELSTGKSAEQIHNFVREQSNEFAGVEGHFRLSVRERDRDFFQSSVQEKGKLFQLLDQPPAGLPDSQQRMIENASQLRRELSKLDDEGRNLLTTFLIRCCYLVVVSTTDQDSAYRIFSVLNDRGLDLSPTDILKAKIIGELDGDIRASYTQIWEDIEDVLGRDNFRSLFAHMRMIYMKDKARGALNKEFQEGVLKSMDGRNFIDNVLEGYANAFERVTLTNPQSEKAFEPVNRYLGHLGLLDNIDWIPPAMEFFKRNENDPNNLVHFVRDLERLAYGMFIRRVNVTGRISRYADVLRAIERGDELFTGGALQLTEVEKLEVLKALNGPIYSLPRVPRPLMLRLDRLLTEGGVSTSHSIISIEHVLPQNPSEGSQWFNWFPDERIRMEWTHKLANLVLLSRRKNSQANNGEFNDKKLTYFMTGGVSPFPLTTQVVAEDEWPPEVLGRRQKYLISALKREWRLN